MGRPFGSGRPTCESAIALDVRDLHRQGLLNSGQLFQRSWTCLGKPAESILVLTEPDAVVLIYSVPVSGGSKRKTIQQRVPITWTDCHLGGRRPWFRCALCMNGQHCGRRVAFLYGADELFACRSCYGLSYANQHESPKYRHIGRARRIRMRLGGSEDLRQPFPLRPRGMHRRGYERLKSRGETADALAFGPLRRWARA
jgi:hypothetical protein